MTNVRSHSTRVALVGVGNVGATFAYVLLLNGLARELVVIDMIQARNEGEAGGANR